MWKAVFVVLGAAVRWAVVWFGSWPGLALFGVSVGHAETFRLGFRLGSALDGRTGRSHSPRKWKSTMAALGAAVGPVIGFFAVYSIALMSPTGDCIRRFGAFFAALLHGAPIGGIEFCLLGLCLGSALDKRSQHRDSQ